MMSRTQLRAAMRERVNTESKQLAASFGIPKAFVTHARRHGKSVADIVQAYMKNKDALMLGAKA